MNKAQKEMILEMRQSFCPYSQIADATGLTPSAVKSYCYRHGLNNEAIKSSNGYCQSCGKPITHPSRTRPRRFCSDTCKTAWWNKHRYEHKHSSAMKKYACVICGKEFFDYGSAERKYCSKNCYQKRGV